MSQHPATVAVASLALAILVGCQALIDVDAYSFSAASAGGADGASGSPAENVAVAGSDGSAGAGSPPDGPVDPPIVTNTCSDTGARECHPDGVRICQGGSWGAPVPCEPGLVCSNGVCATMRVSGRLVSTVPAPSVAPLRLTSHGFETSARACSSAEASMLCVRGGLLP